MGGKSHLLHPQWIRGAGVEITFAHPPEITGITLALYVPLPNGEPLRILVPIQMNTQVEITYDDLIWSRDLYAREHNIT